MMTPDEMATVSAIVIHTILCAMAKEGVGKVVDDMREVNVLREWEDDYSKHPNAIESYHSTIASVAIVNKRYEDKKKGL